MTYGVTGQVFDGSCNVLNSVTSNTPCANGLFECGASATTFTGLNLNGMNYACHSDPDAESCDGHAIQFCVSRLFSIYRRAFLTAVDSALTGTKRPMNCVQDGSQIMFSLKNPTWIYAIYPLPLKVNIVKTVGSSEKGAVDASEADKECVTPDVQAAFLNYGTDMTPASTLAVALESSKEILKHEHHE
ncbi:hypothetical protein BU15DRAFT_73041 [Melanogaster broomeanus]|nr:hypothetical protein BU15DRAFT_73041 [Melanogaster broomeanus]